MQLVSRALRLLFACGLVGCTRGATAVRITIDTDAPIARLMTLQISALRPSGTADNPRVYLRGGNVPSAVSTPASFTVVPAQGAPVDEPARVIVEARVEATATQPPIAFRRTMRFRFTPSATTHLPLFLATGCGAASVGCTSVAPGECTVSVRCDEQGLTCGDEARCVPIDVTPSPDPPDGGPPSMDAGIDGAASPDAGAHDAAPPFDAIDAATDSATDAGCSCAPRANATGTCAGSSCVYRCVDGFSDCNSNGDDGCESLLGTPQNCAACGVTCSGATPVCEARTRCVSGCGALDNCGGACVDVQTSAQHCGACGRACASGMSCVAGACRCGAGQTLCGATCVDVQTSPMHCGMCGRSCPTGRCNSGACAPSNDTCAGATLITEVGRDYTSSTCGAGREVTNCAALPEVFFAVQLPTIFASRVSVSAITGGPYSLAIIGTSCTSAAVSCASSTYSGAFVPGFSQYIAVQGPAGVGCGAFSIRVE